MADVREVIAEVLLGLGTTVAILASLAALRSRSVFRRLHCLTVLTSVAGPLVGLAMVVADGPGLTGATVLVIVVLLAVTGPVLGAATARRNAQRDGVIEAEGPE
ncbi:MAG TPA: monovalent cation/H(+) antiporter subunit G [Pseudonocardiaceae bacterium]|jgi:multicomponent Na+:H+ antiporter subunit G